MDATELLANARRPELPVHIYLGSPELPHERKRLEAKTNRTEEEQTRLAELEAQLNQATLTTRVRAVPHRKWMELVVAHPPRENDREDRQKGVNTTTFWLAAVPLCLPDLTSDQYEQLDAAVSQGEWAKLCDVVELVNTGRTEIPKSLDGSPISLDSEPT